MNHSYLEKKPKNTNTRNRCFAPQSFLLLCCLLLLASCSGVEVIESPKTGFVAKTGETKTPDIIWTSRTLGQSFEYLGVVKSRSWSYSGALEKLLDGAETLRADAVMDVHFEQVGFMNTMQAFAIKYTNAGAK